ncbi:MAG: response regulator [Rhodobacteraceae bacterium]|nr:response regulator [Paracoccaceae bacterium]
MLAKPNGAHLLIVDDDARIRTLLAKFLNKNGYLTTTARDAAHARRLLVGLEFDMLIIDVMMPGENGFDLTRDLRNSLSTPIMLLTARGEPADRITGLKAGADDYLPKPFEPQELLLRVNAILRRSPGQATKPAPPKNLHLGAFRYDIARAELWHGTKLIRLTSTENALMKVFAAKPGETMARSRLVEALGQGDNSAQERAIDVQITRLRRKIEADPKSPRYLQTVRGAGYTIVPD